MNVKKKTKKKKAIKKKASRKSSMKRSIKSSIKSKKTAKAKIEKKIKKKKVEKRKTRGRTIKSKGVKIKAAKKIRQKASPKIINGKEFEEIEQMLLSQRAELLKLISKSAAWEKDISKLERGDFQDMAATSLEREMTFAMGSREREEFLMINSALRKIAEGTYGKCERCGEKINIKRLKIVAFAQYCMECKSIMEHEIEPASEEPFS